MADRPLRPARIQLAPGLDVPRVLTGLWQVADMERDGKPLDPDVAGAALGEYADAGFDAFDMADHYGSAELIVGGFLARAGRARAIAFTKWCPAPGPMTREVVEEGVRQRLQRLGVSRVALLQFHWWQYRHPGYLDAMIELDQLRREGRIGHLGVTNFDTDHLRLLIRHGISVATNQVSFSLLDRRPAGRMTALCRESGVKLLAYGVLAGGFLSDRWVGRSEPTEIPDWSKSKYKRFIDTVGGWDALQGAKLVQVAYILIYLLVAFYIARWRSGMLPVIAALAMIMLIFAAVSAPEWFARDKDGFEDPALEAGVLGMITVLIIPVQVLLIAFAMSGFRQNWHVEVERRKDSPRDDYDDYDERRDPSPQPA